LCEQVTVAVVNITRTGTVFYLLMRWDVPTRCISPATVAVVTDADGRGDNYNLELARTSIVLPVSGR
jgi:hypothetical protein